MSERLSRWLQLAVAWSSIATAAALILIWIGNLLLVPVSQNPAGAQAIVQALDLLGWFELAASVVVVLGLAVGAWFHKPLWARGVALVMAGMVLHWVWWILDRNFDVFGLASLDPAGQLLEQRIALRYWITFALDLLAVPLLVLGGIALLRHPISVPVVWTLPQEESVPRRSHPS